MKVDVGRLTQQECEQLLPEIIDALPEDDLLANPQRQTHYWPARNDSGDVSMNAHALDALQRSASRIAENAERHIRRSYVQDRAAVRRRELRAETDDEIRAAIAAHFGGGQ